MIGFCIRVDPYGFARFTLRSNSSAEALRRNVYSVSGGRKEN
jgi:hypothetical protein